jgi:hypothetical protein
MNVASVRVLKRVCDCLPANLQHVVAHGRVQRVLAALDDDINFSPTVSRQFVRELGERFNQVSGTQRRCP